MYLTPRSQMNYSYTNPASSAEFTRSFDSPNCQKKHLSLDFDTASTLFLPSTYYGLNTTVSENTTLISSNDRQTSPTNGYEKIELPVMNNLKHTASYSSDNLKKLSVCSLSSAVDSVKPELLEKLDENSKITSMHGANSGFSLLNPIFLLARLRTPQHALQFLAKEKVSIARETTGQYDEFCYSTRGVLAYDSDIFGPLAASCMLLISRGCDESCCSTSSPKSLCTDKSPESSISEYNSSPASTEDPCEKRGLEPDFLCWENDSLTDFVLTEPESFQAVPKAFESYSSPIKIEKSMRMQVRQNPSIQSGAVFQFHSPEGKVSKIKANHIQSLEAALSTEDKSKCKDASIFISGSESTRLTQVTKTLKEICKNSRGNNISDFDSITCVKEQIFDLPLILTPMIYNLMPFITKNYNLTSQNDKYFYKETYFNEIKKQQCDRSPTKCPSMESISRHAIPTGQLSNNIISKRRTKPNLIQNFNNEILVSPNSNTKYSNMENLQQLNKLTADSLAAHQRALDFAAFDAENNAKIYQNNVVSDGYLQFEQENSQPSLSNDSFETSSQELTSLLDEYINDFDFNDDSQDIAFIEAVNAEALANDFDGFYGQEFGLYSTELIGKDFGCKNTGNPRSTGSRRTRSSWDSRFVSHEPILSPITECSEYSYYSQCKSPVQQSPRSFREIKSPGLEQFSCERLIENFESINNFDSLLISRRNLSGENQKSVQNFSNCSHWSSDSEEGSVDSNSPQSYGEFLSF
ncbi:hypothetical protein HI914_03121 [Erysiphe necator]|nr:hypothetical protein HI914_03121 [Erysiphe necator]